MRGIHPYLTRKVYVERSTVVIHIMLYEFNKDTNLLTVSEINIASAPSCIG